MHDTNIANFSIPNNSAENSKCGLTAHAHIKGLKAENKVCINNIFLYSAMTRCLLQARGDDYFLIAQTTTFLIVYK